MYVLSSWPVFLSVSTTFSTRSSTPSMLWSRLRYSWSIVAICGSLSRGRFWSHCGSALMSASLNDGVRGACTPANVSA